MSAPTALSSGMINLGDLRVHQLQGGHGPPVLFIHGLGSSGYMEWRFNLEPAAVRHRVYAPDLPGYGRTEKPRVRYTIAYFASFIERYMDDCGLAAAAIVGASLGGRIALEIALENPRLAQRLVLVNALGLGRPKPQMAQMAYGLVTVPHVGEAVMRFTRSALRWAPPRTIRRVAGRFAGSSSDLEKVMDDDYLDNLREMYETRDFHNAYLSTVRSLIHPRALLSGQHDVSQRLSELKMPVQLIWGADDPLFPVAHATRAHALIPDCKLAVIEGAGHTPQAERPDEFNRLLNDFLSA
ncbi:MAG: alpha/beta fold hydrolase [Chloroflexi bacterium]|nr:MAG: alpha/beta fold hydrolase [Chloroflexota bacterium]TME91011.1 MAG: alpha/beta fold hydrolase [Chloroflexota bacterium]